MKELKDYKKSVTVLFLLFIVAYTLRAIYLFEEGKTTEMSEFFRNELQFLFWPLIDSLSIIPVLIFHHTNFSSFKPQEPDPEEDETFVPIGQTNAIEAQSQNFEIF